MRVSLSIRELPETLGSMVGMTDKQPEATILVVDDEPSIRELLSASLRFAGFDVLAAADGREALDHQSGAHIDIAVLDIMLPDADGFTILRRLREHDPELPVLFLTARDDVKDKIQGLTVGGDDYITKPFSLEEVVARIRAVLRRTRPSGESAVLRYADLELNEETYDVSRAGSWNPTSPTCGAKSTRRTPWASPIRRRPRPSFRSSTPNAESATSCAEPGSPCRSPPPMRLARKCGAP